MLTALLIFAATAWATCPQANTFTFAGQPDCVDVAYEGGRIQLTNTCSDTLLIDASLQLHAAGEPALPIIPANTTVEIRDLSFFTLGMGGELYKVVAYLETAAADCGDTGTPARDAG